MDTVRVWKETPTVQLLPIEIDDMLNTAERNSRREILQRDNSIRWNVEEEIVTALHLSFKKAVAVIEFIVKVNGFMHQKFETQLATDTDFHLVYLTDSDHGKNAVIIILEGPYQEDQACHTVKKLYLMTTLRDLGGDGDRYGIGDSLVFWITKCNNERRSGIMEFARGNLIYGRCLWYCWVSRGFLFILRGVYQSDVLSA